MSNYDVNYKDISRRTLLASFGVGTGVLLTNGGLPSWRTKSNIHDLSFREALSLLDLSLSPEQRSIVVLPWNDPSRQITNTVAIHKGPHIATLFDPYQVRLLRQLYRTMLSSQGRSWFRNTTSLEGKFEGSSFRLYSDAAAGELAASNKTIAMINGGHYMLRHGHRLASDEAYVFGGPIAYGQQLGNNVFRAQGNAFKAHGDAVNEFYAVLGTSERRGAYQLLPPMELVTQVQGANGNFSGLRIGDTSPRAQALAKNMLAIIFAAYPESQQRDAFSAIEKNGGIKSLYISLYRDYSFYQDGQRPVDLPAEKVASREDPYTQVWRIEGPACVIHFKGYPHVHGYINVVHNPNKVAIGEVIASAKSAIQGENIRNLLLAALRYETGERFAYFPMPVAGRIAQGAVSTGSIYALDPFDNYAMVVEIDESAMSVKLKTSLASQGANLSRGKRIRLATASYMLEDPRDLGVISNVISTGAPIRESLINLIRNDDSVLSA